MKTTTTNPHTTSGASAASTAPDHIQPPAPSPANPISKASREFLHAEGLDDRTINDALKNTRAKRPSRGAKNGGITLEKITADAAEIIAMAKGKKLIRAKGCGLALVALGAIRRPKGWQAVGDALGGHGLALPWVKLKSITYYDLGYIGRTSEECEARTECLAALDIEALQLVVGEISEEMSIRARAQRAEASHPAQVATDDLDVQSASSEHLGEAANDANESLPDDSGYTEGEPVGGYAEDQD